MKIKNLPPPIKRLAKRNVEKQRGFLTKIGYYCSGDNIDVRKAFLWHDTIEGYEFWYQVDNGNFHFEPRKEVKV